MAVDTKSMGFNLPELVLESVIRDGIQNVRADTQIITDIFTQLTRAYNTNKYGSTEVTKIQALMNKEIPVVFSYLDVDAKAPCFSIMIGSEDEDRRRDHLGDTYFDETDDITDPVELANLVKVANITPTAYDPLSGKISVDDSVDLSQTYKGLIFVDAVDTEHPLAGGIDNTPGQKCFFVNKGDEVDISGPGEIKSSLDYTLSEIHGTTSDIRLVVGVHARDALTVKYLYILLKYFILSRKKDLISRGLYLPMLSGSDFNRNQEVLGDRVFHRFLTLTGKVDDTWRNDQVVLIDNVVICGEPID